MIPLMVDQSEPAFLFGSHMLGTIFSDLKCGLTPSPNSYWARTRNWNRVAAFLSA
jgi:hypothetical protein